MRQGDSRGKDADRLRLTLDPESRLGAKIKVIGVGGGGSNAVSRMVATGLEGVEFIVANTDAQALGQNPAAVKIQIGQKLTQGTRGRRGSEHRPGGGARGHRHAHSGAGRRRHDFRHGRPGRRHRHGRRTRDREPGQRARRADGGGRHQALQVRGKEACAAKAMPASTRLRECVDTVITIPNERLLAIIDRQTPLTDSFQLADDVLRQAIQGISDLILVPGLINLDFADVKTIMSGMGVAMMGTGVGEGDNRAMQAAQKAVSSPLLEDGSVNGARGVIINVTGGPDLSLMEVNEASCVIQEAAHEDANIIFGAVVDPKLAGKVKITVIATGFDRGSQGSVGPAAAVQTPVDLQNYTAHVNRAAAVWFERSSGAGDGRCRCPSQRRLRRSR